MIGDNDDALADFGRVLELEPQNIKALLNLKNGSTKRRSAST